MENLLLVPGEIIGLDISTLYNITAKERTKLHKLQISNNQNIKFLPCIYAGQNKKGAHKLLVAQMQEADGDGVAFVATDRIITIKPEEAEDIIGRYMGVIHGTIASLPSVIPIPGYPNVGIKIRTEAENKFTFIANIEKNIKAVTKHAKSSPQMRALIYGPPSSGKSSLADKLASETGYPWVTVSPKWLTIGGQGAMNALSYIVALSTQRQFGILFDDIDELLGLMSNAGGTEGEEESSAGLGLAAHYFILEAMKSHPMPLIFTAVGRFSIDHIISQCNVFFSLHFSPEDMRQIWNEICPTAKELGEEIADENLPLAMMYAVVKQAEMVAKLNKRNTPNQDDVKTALTCFGKREDPKPGFGR